MSVPYRREIDGLRAVAVSAVVLYHAGFGPSAGYVGVDVFFVISGYLITALLLREYGARGRIDLADFYARRIRRILPASVAVILASVVAAFLFPHPGSILKSAAAACLFVANLFFEGSVSGYFHDDAGQMPLLHLWSLSVEEQFYLFWPALLIVLLRFRVRLLPALAGLALASLVYGEWLMNGFPSSAFYQMPARFWELAAGGLIAAMPARKLPEGSAWLGLALTIAACFLSVSHFPATGAIPVVAATSLLLAAIHGGATNPLLASRPMVGIGLISYSLYLWHWPLLAFDRLLRIGPSPFEARLTLVAAAVVLACLSYRYIETPLRKPWTTSRRTVAIGFSAMVVISVVAWSWKDPDPVEIYADYPKYCHPYVDGKPVTMSAPHCFPDIPRVVIWGDSYAFAWTPMALALADKLKMPAVTLARFGCPPMPAAELRLRSPMEAKNCQKWNDAAITDLRTNGADTVILVARWQNFIGADGGETSLPALTKAIADISPHVRRILVIAPTPELTDPPEKCASRGVDCAIPRAAFEKSAQQARKAIKGLSSPQVTVTDPSDWFCGPERCPGIRGGLALYADTIHVSRVAATYYSMRVAKYWK